MLELYSLCVCVLISFESYVNRRAIFLPICGNWHISKMSKSFMQNAYRFKAIGKLETKQLNRFRLGISAIDTENGYTNASNLYYSSMELLKFPLERLINTILPNFGETAQFDMLIQDWWWWRKKWIQVVILLICRTSRDNLPGANEAKQKKIAPRFRSKWLQLDEYSLHWPKIYLPNLIGRLKAMPAWHTQQNVDGSR